MILIASSEEDVASLNIKTQILKHYDLRRTAEKFQGNEVHVAEINGRNVKLVTLDKELTYAQDVANAFVDSELVIFISRHSSISATPTLSTHTPGNLGEARFGGISRRVSVAPGNLMREALKVMMKLKEEFNLDYEVSYECTHHGPSLDVPAMFVELGSSPKQWKDSRAAEVVAHATMEAISRFGAAAVDTVLGIGGPHYNRKFTKMALGDEVAFGHIVPKYAVANLDSEILRQCIDRTVEKVEFTTLDWKGIRGGHKSELIRMLREANVQFRKV
jgi:D-aminoacyl-tRNA deacylase